MIGLTEATLAGDWFYLESDELLDRVHSAYWRLAGGRVLKGGRAIGSYAVFDGQARLVLYPSGDAQRIEIVALATARPDALSTTEMIWFAVGEELQVFGAMFRRVADYQATAALMKRLGLKR